LPQLRAASDHEFLVMRAIRLVLTALGFLAVFAVLMISSAIITSAVHKAVLSPPTFSDGS
jgi:hypothetical protein